MSIDTGQTLIYNANFPVPNVDQSSQQFRDNFTVVKTAIENLQLATNDNTSVMAISSTLGTGGSVHTNITYNNNTLILPTVSNATPSAGMIRFSAGTIQFFDGANWLSSVFKDASGLVTIPNATFSTSATITYSTFNSNSIVPKSYIDGLFSMSNSNSSTIQAQLDQEITDRANGVAGAEANAAIANSTANQAFDGLASVANSLATAITISQQASDSANAAVGAADNAANVATQAASDASNAAAQANAISDTANAALVAADDASNTAILANAAVANVATGLAQEIIDRTNADLTIRSDFNFAITQANSAGISNVYTIANNVVGLSALLANATGSDANAVQKTGDTMSGALSITATGNALVVNGNAHMTGNLVVDGTIYAAGDITAFSDMALKYNIETIPNALAKVQALRGTTFNRVDLKGNPEQVGFIAQEVQGIMPQVVHEHPDNGLLSVSYGNLVALLVEAVKELSAEVAALKAK